MTRMSAQAAREAVFLRIYWGYGVLNLDAMIEDELLIFASISPVSRVVAALWPDRRFTDEVGMVVVCLQQYATLSARAQDARREGAILAAQHLEDDADEIYSRLPAWVQW